MPRRYFDAFDAAFAFILLITPFRYAAASITLIFFAAITAISFRRRLLPLHAAIFIRHFAALRFSAAHFIAATPTL